MTRFLLLLLTMSSLSCASATPQDKGRIIKGSLDASRAGCLVLFSDPRIPRDTETLDSCICLTGSAITLKPEVRKVQAP